MRRNCGVYYNQGRVVSTLVLFPIALVFASMERFLLACSWDPIVSKIACNYVVYMIPATWFFGQFDCSMRFLGAQYINKIPIYTQLFSTSLHVLWCYIFVQRMNLGELGVALAINITYFLNMAITDALLRYKTERFGDMIFWYDESSFTNLGPYVTLAFQGMLLSIAEFSIFDVLNVVAGTISVQAAAAQSISTQMGDLVYMFAIGFSYASSAFTGNYIGQNQIGMAKKFSKFIVAYGFVFILLLSSAIYIKRDFVSSIFTKDPKIVAIMLQIMPYYCMQICFDCIHAIQMGVIKGLGLQGPGSKIALLCNYVVGLPLGLVLGLKY